eukprot:13264458-Alexandrium_andersonii.AAC.1
MAPHHCPKPTSLQGLGTTTPLGRGGTTLGVELHPPLAWGPRAMNPPGAALLGPQETAPS